MNGSTMPGRGTEPEARRPRRTARNVALLVAGGIVLAGLAGGTASADVRSSASWGYSMDINRGYQVMVCDTLGDSRSVYAEYLRVGYEGQWRFDDKNGANNACAYSGYQTPIYKHRVSRNQPFKIDDHASWQYVR